MKSINVNLKALESMLFIWASLMDKEKISDLVLSDLANSAELAGAYDDEFTKDSFRKVLSAISNREKLNSTNKKESRFWNYNMWMLEDKEMTDAMINPIKVLNVDSIKGDINSTGYDEAEVIFFPGHYDLYKIIENKLYINFFLIKVDIYNDNRISLDGMEIIDFVKAKLQEIK